MLVILYSRGKGKELKDAEQGCIADTLTSNLPEEPSETASADIIKVRRLALTSLKRTQSQSIFDP